MVERSKGKSILVFEKIVLQIREREKFLNLVEKMTGPQF